MFARFEVKICPAQRNSHVQAAEAGKGVLNIFDSFPNVEKEARILMSLKLMLM